MELTLASPQNFSARVNYIITNLPRKREPGTEIGPVHHVIFNYYELMQYYHYPVFVVNFLPLNI